MSGEQWFALLILGAVAAVGLGIWQITNGNTGAGWLLIAIAVADVILVATLRRLRRGGQP